MQGFAEAVGALFDAIEFGVGEVGVESGAVADICSTVLDASGEPAGGGLVPARCISITTEQLRAIPDVVALAAGPDKAQAIAATIRAGLLHRLITDTSAARALLDM